MADPNYTRDVSSTDREWPTTWKQKHERVKRRQAAYLGLPYDRDEVQALGLFQATNGDGDVIHTTRRISRDQAFVVDTCVSALITDLTLNMHPDWYRDNDIDDNERAAPENAAAVGLSLAEGEQIWHRSHVHDKAEGWARSGCIAGDWHFEPQLNDEQQGTIVLHPPEHVEVYYDDQNVDLELAVIAFQYTDPPTGDMADGPGEVHEYRRVLTRDEVRTYIDGKMSAEHSYEHGLGRVPLVHAQFKASHDPTFGLPAAYGLEYPGGVYDGITTMVSVIGQRNADPLLVIAGQAMPQQGDNDKSRLDRILQVLKDTDVSFLESTLQGLTALATIGENVRNAMVQATPAFAFADAGANASGTALSYRGQRFVSEIAPTRGRLHRAFATVTTMAWCMQNGVSYPEGERFQVDAAPALPQDKMALYDLTERQTEGGFLTRADAVERLQGLGLVPATEAPSEYAIRAQDEADTLTVKSVDQIARLNGFAPRDAPDELPDDDDESEDEDAA